MFAAAAAAAASFCPIRGRFSISTVLFRTIRTVACCIYISFGINFKFVLILIVFYFDFCFPSLFCVRIPFLFSIFAGNCSYVQFSLPLLFCFLSKNKLSADELVPDAECHCVKNRALTDFCYWIPLFLNSMVDGRTPDAGNRCLKNLNQKWISCS